MVLVAVHRSRVHRWGVPAATVDSRRAASRSRQGASGARARRDGADGAEPTATAHPDDRCQSGEGSAGEPPDLAVAVEWVGASIGDGLGARRVGDRSGDSNFGVLVDGRWQHGHVHRRRYTVPARYGPEGVIAGLWPHLPHLVGTSAISSVPGHRDGALDGHLVGCRPRRDLPGHDHDQQRGLPRRGIPSPEQRWLTLAGTTSLPQPHTPSARCTRSAMRRTTPMPGGPA